LRADSHQKCRHKRNLQRHNLPSQRGQLFPPPQ
jgi:hypothetical protein